MKKLVIFDASSHQYRAFYGKKEDPISGLAWQIDDAMERHKPDEGIVAYDHRQETWRSKLYPKYKAERKPTPPEYIALKPAFEQCFAEHGLRPLSVAGQEADDIIATVCARLDSYQIVILSRDKDLMQLVRDGLVSMAHDENITQEAEVFAKFGVKPSLVPDVLGLMGDATDGIPGVAGIGAKNASKIISEHGRLEDVYDNLAKIPDKVRQLLKAGKEAAFLSRELATLKCDVELGDL